MAMLICKDGTEVEISDETEQNLRKKFGKKKEFEKIKLCHLRIEVKSGDKHTVTLSWQDSDQFCYESADGIRTIIKGLQSAIDYIEKNET